MPLLGKVRDINICGQFCAFLAVWGTDWSLWGTQWVAVMRGVDPLWRNPKRLQQQQTPIHRANLGIFFRNMLICKLVFAVKQALIILTCSHYVSQATVAGNVALNNEADLCLENCSEPAAHPWSVSREPGLCVDAQVGRATSASISESLPVEMRDNKRK